jgi:hypothetical protein
VLLDFSFKDVKAQRISDGETADFRYRNECSQLVTKEVATGQVYLNICVSSQTSLKDNTTRYVTQFDQYRYAGDVTYLSANYTYEWYNGLPTYSYTYNHETGSQVGIPITDFAQDQVALRTVFHASNAVYVASADVPLELQSWKTGSPEPFCDPEYHYTSGSYSYVYQTCWTIFNSYDLRIGTFGGKATKKELIP